MRYFIAVIIIIIIVKLIASYTFNYKIKNEITNVFKDIKYNKEIIDQNAVKKLPVPVQKWLRVSGVLNRKPISSAELTQTGKIRLKPKGKWLNFQARQYFTSNKPAFLWKVKVKFLPLINLVGRDLYKAGKGSMLIKLASLLKIVDASGREIDQGSLLRYLGEIVWFPSAALSDYINWESIDENKAKAIMSYGEITAEAIFEFNEDGLPKKYRCKRFYSSGKKSYPEDYEVQIDSYGKFSNYNIPKTGRAIWKLESGNFECLNFNIESVKYNFLQTSE